MLGTSGVESGKAAPLVGGPPGVVLHTVVDGLPTEDTGDMVPVVLPTNGVRIVPNAIPGIIVVDDIIVLCCPPWMWRRWLVPSMASVRWALR